MTKYFKSAVSFLIFYLIFLIPTLLNAFVLSFPIDDFNPKIKWRTLATKYFHIHFYPAEETAAKHLASLADNIYAELSKRIGWETKGKIEVVLTEQNDLPNGAATPYPYPYIILQTPPPSIDDFPIDYDDWLATLFSHELTHVLHTDKHGGMMRPLRKLFGTVIVPNALSPRWTIEGLAVDTESRNGKGRNHNRIADMVLRTDILNKQFVDIRDASGTIGWPNGHTPYLYGGRFWEYLTKQHGLFKIAEFTKDYGEFYRSFNGQAKKSFGKKFPVLWQEWKASLEERYENDLKKLEKLGLSELEKISDSKPNESFSVPTLSPDQKVLAYVKTNLDGPSEIHLKELATGSEKILLKKYAPKQLSFSPDGTKLVFAALVNTEHTHFFDLYELDLKSQRLKRLTKNERAKDPDYAPDQKTLVYVKTFGDRNTLMVHDIKTNKQKPLIETSAWTQISNPRFSPDGQQIVASVFKNGRRDLVLYDLNTQKEHSLTYDVANESDPVWSSDGKAIYFSSDRDGIPNLYRVWIANPLKHERLSRVATGLFHPQVLKNADGSNTLIAEHYFGRGKNLVGLRDKTLETIKIEKNTPKDTDTNGSKNENALFSEKKYNPFKKLLRPHFLLPAFQWTETGTEFSISTGNTDPLHFHEWSIALRYRTDANFWGGQFSYLYNRLALPFYVAFDRSVVNYGDRFKTGENFFEERNKAYAGFYKKGLHTLFNIYYTFQNRRSQTTLTPDQEAKTDLGNAAGIGASFVYHKTDRYPASISPENGLYFRLSSEIFDTKLGSTENNAIKVIETEFRNYFRIPGTKHHVFAFKAAAGVNFGDKLSQGVFRLGTHLSDQSSGFGPSYLYPLRGLPQVSFAGNRVLFFSGEYRLPLLWVDRGVTSTGLALVKDLHLSFFSDWGSVFENNPKFENFIGSVGAELRADFLIKHSFPLTTRLGYGVVIKGREFLGNRTDPITGSNIKNGALIFQVGTSF